MLARALPFLLLASAVVVGCNLLTGVGTLETEDIDASALPDSAPSPAPTTTSTVAPPPIERGASSRSGAIDSGLEAEAEAEAEAAPPPILTGDFDGHHYEVVLSAGLTWPLARDGAIAKGGHLVTITSADENEFVRALAVGAGVWSDDGHGPWLGATQEIIDGGEPDLGWTWVTNESWSYTNWLAGEPNNSGGAENYLHFYGDPAGGAWNDINETGDASVLGYIVEYEP
jgi:hypothetical protein